jgi:hypothetical protein
MGWIYIEHLTKGSRKKFSSRKPVRKKEYLCADMDKIFNMDLKVK